MRTCTVIALAVALALAGCKKEEKGASQDKKDEQEEKADDKAKTDESAVKEDKAPDDKATTPPPEVKKDEPVAETKDEPPLQPAAPVVADDSVTLGYALPAVGAKYTKELTVLMDLKVSAQGQTFPMTGERTEKKVWEVLEVGPDTVTKAKVTYEKSSDVQKMGGKTNGGPGPLEGKTYTLTAGSPIAVDTDAGPASNDEATLVREEEDDFGGTAKMARMLAGKTFKKDEPVELSGDEVAAAIGADKGIKMAKITLTYRGMEGDLAKFDMKMTMSGENKGSDMTIDLSGSGTVDPKMGDLITMDMTGSFKMTGKADADGTMTMKAVRSR